MELRQRITEINLTDFNIENKENIPQIFQVKGEPNWCEKLIIVTKKKEILANVLTWHYDLLSLTKTEWNELLNPSPPNKLVDNYFKNLYSAFKTNAQSKQRT